MFHFFEKNREYIRCELHEQPDGRWQVVVTEQTGYERTEHFASSDRAHARWQELRTQFLEDGWFGPYGRE